MHSYAFKHSYKRQKVTVKLRNASHITASFDVVLMTSLLTQNRLHGLSWCFHCWLEQMPAGFIHTYFSSKSVIFDELSLNFSCNLCIKSDGLSFRHSSSCLIDSNDDSIVSSQLCSLDKNLTTQFYKNRVWKIEKMKERLGVLFVSLQDKLC